MSHFVTGLVSRFLSNPSVERTLIKKFGLDRSIIAKNSRKFKQQLSEEQIHNIRSGFKSGVSMEQLIAPLFLGFTMKTEPKLKELKKQVDSFQIGSPEQWYPAARTMKRKIVMHLGPTNSGKTYHAMNRLIEAPTGIYCCPLRLLAFEVTEKLNELGISCSLLTGEEKRMIPNASKLACTVEMASLETIFDVAVIDEIQMIGDPHRGWAWTRAFLGLQAKEIHVCGDPAAQKMIEQLAKLTGDEVDIKRYNRLTSLSVAKSSLEKDLRQLQPGDAFICFTQADIFKYRDTIEMMTGHKCAVIYGALPPEIRTQQARLFNDPSSDHQILVATDAIGMGLNLNIKRIVFETTVKRDDRLSVSDLKQIAGRAGRFNTRFSDGEVTCFRPIDFRFIEYSLKTTTPELTHVGIMPSVEHFESFKQAYPDEPFEQVLVRMQYLLQMKYPFFCLSNLEDMKTIVNVIEPLNLAFNDVLVFANAPISIKKKGNLPVLVYFATCHAQRKPVQLNDLIRIPESAPVTPRGLKLLESHYQILSCYKWLGQRFPETFCYLSEAREAQSMIRDMMVTCLEARK